MTWAVNPGQGSGCEAAGEAWVLSSPITVQQSSSKCRQFSQWGMTKSITVHWGNLAQAHVGITVATGSWLEAKLK